jgi:hypothetical protein
MRVVPKLIKLSVCVGILCANSGDPIVPRLTVCQAIEIAPQLLGRPIIVQGWYGNTTGYWGAVGDGDCTEVLIEPKIDRDAKLNFAAASDEVSDHTQKMIRGGFWPLWDFRASFHGILKKREVSPDDQPELHGLPAQKVMPYVLEIDQIDRIQIERATFWTEPPPLP